MNKKMYTVAIKTTAARPTLGLICVLRATQPGRCAAPRASQAAARQLGAAWPPAASAGGLSARATRRIPQRPGRSVEARPVMGPASLGSLATVRTRGPEAELCPTCRIYICVLLSH